MMPSESKTNLYFCAMFKKTVSLWAGFMMLSCTKEVHPKPSGELRLEYPTPKYGNFASSCDFSFQVSDYSKVVNAKNPCWYYIEYPEMKAKVFITYFPVHNDLNLHIKESEKMVYEHTIKATAIDTKSFSYPEKRVFGTFYELKGPSASNLQFYATDSLRHYVTANLYFNTRPKPDSLAPAIAYIKNDMLHLIDTFQWRGNKNNTITKTK